MEVEILEAARQISEGKCVAVPTETVYGLAASIALDEAISLLYKLKKRTHSKPTTIAIDKMDQLDHLTTNLPPFTLELAKAFWPGPLTLVLPANLNTVPERIRGKCDTVGIRIPNHPDLLSLLSITGPLALPSANPSGEKPPISMQEVEEYYSTQFPVLYGGNSELKVASTLIQYIDGKWTLLRKGALTTKKISNIIGYEPVAK
ncbi:MAG: L-threonylcarbamoyladenylate synthase [Rhabdochlamydiaceae bacterium]|nr:L-threonylcarbamoyladenylate synthase [Candidatus Amphrikana amoebophyrae]